MKAADCPTFRNLLRDTSLGIRPPDEWSPYDPYPSPASIQPLRGFFDN